ncbi:hypothetical protein EON79_06655 [bacterium]|nr:MAG: hypothetical protein EON79_06655 [bacterium]
MAGVVAAGVATPALGRAIAFTGAYGWTTLVIVPLLMGFCSMLLLGLKEDATLGQGAIATIWSLVLFSAGALIFRLEGAICLIMASPMVLLVALFGTMVGKSIFDIVRDKRGRMQVSLLAMAMPLAVTFVVKEPSSYEERTVTTTTWIAAPPEKIWPYLENIDRVSEPHWWLFRMGVAHPVATRTKGNIRHCVLSTGDMPERLLIREPGRRLRWRVMSTPALVREVNPFGTVHAPHDRDRFVARIGEWKLTRENGGTRLVGRTEYGHRFGAPLYWNLWTDVVVGNVHRQMIREITERATR